MNTDEPTHVSRRTVLKASAAAGAAAVGTTAFAGGAAAQDGSLGEWLSNVGNFDGVVDETGKDEVTVTVGSEANGGPYGFGPAAIRVDPGTKVVWEWKSGTHNVVADDGSYESAMKGEQGFTFSQTFDSEGVSKYYCNPHKAMGMKGAVVVGDVEVDTGASGGSGGGGSDGGDAESTESVDFGGWFDNVGNFDGVVDETGKSEVTVTVGSEGNGGPYGFGPAAVRVDPGTTVVWEWKSGTHNVVANDGAYESEMVGEQGHTFSQTFDSEGVSKYYCQPHEAMGMKGAVVVGDGGGGSGGDAGGLSMEEFGVLGFAGVLIAGLLSPFAAKAFGKSEE
ncbi:halocyanin domain-containing protein [Halobacterium litoreum]|uniref:Halocyanin domain-containing protein n=1 Tax=Halobacterium litoreum TaxID=2039234 RepID=A0ABD5NC08_9EURY|nr:halocyanin domain-containing protein [Halobacterium litoreum]UHH14381.1 halocyanin domain-containing protein [Halobacterium litoreum]